MAQNSITDSSLQSHSIYAAGTTGLATAAATVIPPGCIYAAASIRAPKIATSSFTSSGAIVGTTITGTTITGTTGFVFANSAVKKFACGTIYTTGGATAPITATGLTTITHIFMQLNKAAYSSATTGMAYSRPCVAAGTPGSFYPLAFKVTGAPGPVLNTVAGTWRYHALGA